VRVAGRAFPLVIAAPSGTGKTSLARALVERHQDVVFSISATTRPRREYERPGVDYVFVDQARFAAMAEAGELAEWAEVHGRSYGTPREGVAAALAQGRVVVLDIDVQGARQVRAAFPDAVLVFILPPSAAELARRLSRRGSEDGAERQRRLGNARAELEGADEFDYVVVNDDFDTALGALDAIVEAERHRATRAADLAGTLHRLDRELAALMNERSN
jgi:guanylate kinase